MLVITDCCVVNLVCERLWRSAVVVAEEAAAASGVAEEVSAIVVDVVVSIEIEGKCNQ